MQVCGICRHNRTCLAGKLVRWISCHSSTSMLCMCRENAILWQMHCHVGRIWPRLLIPQCRVLLCCNEFVQRRMQRAELRGKLPMIWREKKSTRFACETVSFVVNCKAMMFL